MFTFCKPVSSKKRFLPHRKLTGDFSFTLFEKADAIPTKEWESITNRNTIFLEPAYLRIVEGCLHTRLVCRYVIVYQHSDPCGIIYYQVTDFKAEVFGDLLTTREGAADSKRLNLFEKYIDANKQEVLMRLFTCGNNLVSGEYGFRFSETIDPELANSLLLQITDAVSKEERLKGTISAILLKDFHAPLQPEKLLKEERYTRFFVEPNLVVSIPPGVESLSGYIELFSKKYRNRAKAIFKSFEGIEVKDLSLEEIRAREAEIYALYESIFNNAKFRLNKLPLDYFSSVKALFEKKFHVKAFFYNGKMVAFGSCFQMPDGSMEAHYIGFSYALNSRFNLYQNLLYVMIEQAIILKKKKVNLGRTAAEIKTTVGAKAEDLTCYIRPQNTISKLIQRPFIDLLQPAEWIPRNPFREELSPGAVKAD